MRTQVRGISMVGAYKNAMEMLVEEEVERQVRALPPRVVSYINQTELVAYALNQLPPLYATSEKGLEFQIQRGRVKLAVQVSQAVQRAIAAIRRDPLRSYVPLQPQQSTHLRDVLHQLRLVLKNDSLNWENLPVAIRHAIDTNRGGFSTTTPGQDAYRHAPAGQVSRSRIMPQSMRSPFASDLPTQIEPPVTPPPAASRSSGLPPVTPPPPQPGVRRPAAQNSAFAVPPPPASRPIASAGRPLSNSQANPQANPLLNPQSNLRSNSQLNPQSNPQANSRANSPANSQLNPQSNLQSNPLGNPGAPSNRPPNAPPNAPPNTPPNAKKSKQNENDAGDFFGWDDPFYRL
ncbi:MAG TPA: late competence development ComFB family protein [Chroococcidiopsis sp.]